MTGSNISSSSSANMMMIPSPTLPTPSPSKSGSSTKFLFLPHASHESFPPHTLCSTDIPFDSPVHFDVFSHCFFDGPPLITHPVALRLEIVVSQRVPSHRDAERVSPQLHSVSKRVLHVFPKFLLFRCKTSVRLSPRTHTCCLIHTPCLFHSCCRSCVGWCLARRFRGTSSFSTPFITMIRTIRPITESINLVRNLFAS